MHRVRSGDTLGGIALRYNSSIQAIKKANRMRGFFLRIGQENETPELQSVSIVATGYGVATRNLGAQSTPQQRHNTIALGCAIPPKN